MCMRKYTVVDKPTPLNGISNYKLSITFLSLMTLKSIPSSPIKVTVWLMNISGIPFKF